MKSVKKNFFWVALTELLKLILPIATSPYLARTLGAGGVGVFAYTQSVSSTFKTCMDLGIYTYGRRSVAKARNSQEKLNERFSNLFALHFVIALLGVTAYFCYAFFFSEHKTVALIMGLGVVESLFCVNWLYFGMEQMKVTALRFLIIKTLSFFLIFLFVRGEFALEKYAFLIASSALVSELTLWFHLGSMVSFVRPSFKGALSHLSGLLFLFIPTLLETIYHTMDKIMLGGLSGMAQVGYYDYAGKSLIVRNVLTSLGTALLPRIAYLHANRDYQRMWTYIDQSLRVSVCLSFGLSFGVAAVASDFAPLFWGEAFSPCAGVMFTLSLSTPFWAVAQVIRNQFLIPTDRDREYIASIFIGAGVNLVLNFLLIPKFGGVGAAAATVVTEAVICVFQAYVVREEFLTGISMRNYLPYALLGLIMFLGVMSLKAALPTTWFAFFMEVAFGSVLYGGLCCVYWIITKDAFFLNLAKTALEKLKFFRKN